MEKLFFGCGHTDENGEFDCTASSENPEWFCEDHPEAIVLTLLGRVTEEE